MGYVPFDEMMKKHRHKVDGVVNQVSSFKPLNGGAVQYRRSRRESMDTRRSPCPRYIVEDKLEAGNNHMTLHDAVMGRPVFEVRGQ